MLCTFNASSHTPPSTHPRTHAPHPIHPSHPCTHTPSHPHPSHHIPTYPHTQTVYNWQYVHCLDLWTRVLGEVHHDALRPLVYPLVQTTLGALQLQPTARYYPLRLHCVETLLNLIASTGTYIPLPPYLLEVNKGGSNTVDRKKFSVKNFSPVALAAKIKRANFFCAFNTHSIFHHVAKNRRVNVSSVKKIYGKIPRSPV